MIKQKLVFDYECDFCGEKTDKNYNKENKVTLRSDKDHVWFVAFNTELYAPYVDEDKRCICKNCLIESLQKCIDRFKD